MRLLLTFENKKGFIALPIHHHHILQGFIYRNLPKHLSDFLHNQGFYYNKSSLKLFTFSKIFSDKFHIKNHTIYYKTPITIYLSSIINILIKSFQKIISVKEKIQFGKNEIILKKIEFLENPEILSNPFKIQTLSPIVVYKTLQNHKKYTKYYFPTDIEFNDLIKENLKKKYQIITGNINEDFDFHIKGIKTYSKILKYKNFIIKGSEGVFEISLNPEIFKIIYDSGLGSKNSQGFGMIEIV